GQEPLHACISEPPEPARHARPARHRTSELFGHILEASVGAAGADTYRDLLQDATVHGIFLSEPLPHRQRQFLPGETANARLRDRDLTSAQDELTRDVAVPVRLPFCTPHSPRAAQSLAVLLEHLHHTREPLGEHHVEQLRPRVHTPLSKGRSARRTRPPRGKLGTPRGLFRAILLHDGGLLVEIQPDDAIGSGDRRHLSTFSGTSPRTGAEISSPGRTLALGENPQLVSRVTWLLRYPKSRTLLVRDSVQVVTRCNQVRTTPVGLLWLGPVFSKPPS